MLEILKKRFCENMDRHPGLSWEDVEARLTPGTLSALCRMEETGGEPDALEWNGGVVYCDFSRETPAARRSLCYDEEALRKRAKNPPSGSAEKQAQEMGVKLMPEDMYRALQSVEPVDLKTSSWIATPAGIRSLGGALFCERRYNTVFVFHNGADSYYSVRGWRGYIDV